MASCFDSCQSRSWRENTASIAARSDAFERRRQPEVFTHPRLQLVARLGLWFGHRHLFRTHQVTLGHPLSHIVCIPPYKGTHCAPWPEARSL